MNTDFSQNLRQLLQQMNLTSAQLAKAINVDPSLVSRWLRSGCGERKASVHALSVGRYIASRRLSPENTAWLAATLGCADARQITAERVAVWLYPNADVPAPEQEETFANLFVVDSFHDTVLGQAPADGGNTALGVCRGAGDIAALLASELERADIGAHIHVAREDRIDVF